MGRVERKVITGSWIACQKIGTSRCRENSTDEIERWLGEEITTDSVVQLDGKGKVKRVRGQINAWKDRIKVADE